MKPLLIPIGPLALLLTAPLAADVIVVDALGAGDHPTLNAAIAAAQDGDYLLVRGGTYAGFDLDGKTLVVEAERGALVLIDGPSRVANLAGNGSVSLRGLTFLTPGQAPTPPEGALLVDSCAGAVVVQDCNLTQPGPLVFGGLTAALVRDSDRVSFVRSNLSVVGASLFSPSPAGLLALDSSVHLYQCTVTGGPGSSTFFGGDGSGAPGVSVEGGQLFAYDSHLVGGRGAAGNVRGGCTHGGPGGSGLRLGSNSPSVTLKDTFLEGGPGGPPGDPSFCLTGPVGAPSVVETGTLAEIPGLSPRRLSLESPVREGEVSTAFFEGQPGDFVYRLLSPGPSALFLPDVNGSLLLKSPVILLPQGTLDAQGERMVSTPVTDFGLDHFTVFEQALFISVLENAFVLSNPQLVTLLDPAF